MKYYNRPITKELEKVEPKRWTRQAAVCYCIGSVCSKCDIPEDMRSKCQMRDTMIELVTLHGKPSNKYLQQIRTELGEDCILAENSIIED